MTTRTAPTNFYSYDLEVGVNELKAGATDDKVVQLSAIRVATFSTVLHTAHCIRGGEKIMTGDRAIKSRSIVNEIRGLLQMRIVGQGYTIQMTRLEFNNAKALGRNFFGSIIITD